MAYSYSTADCLKGALAYAGELTDGTSRYHSIALKFLDNLHKALLSGPTEFDPELRTIWSWARQSSTFTLPPVYKTGTVSATNGNTTITFSVAPTISLANYNIKLDNYDSWYTISSHTANTTTAVLDGAWVDTSASTQSFKAVPLVVDLGSGILNIADAFRIYKTRILEPGEKAEDSGKIYGCPTREFWQKYPLRILQNDIPSRFTIISRSESSLKVRFNKYVSTTLKVDFDKISIPTTLTDDSNSIPLIPFDYREILETGGAYYLLLHKKQPNEAQVYFLRTQAKIRAMQSAEMKVAKNISKNFGRLIPRLDDQPYPFYLIEK